MAENTVNIPVPKKTTIQVNSELNKFIGSSKPSGIAPVKLP
jgi:hypothetical protein